MNPILELHGVTKSFVGNIVLDQVDLDVYPGSVHAVVGENGAGKSTLMKIVGGIHVRNSGEVKLFGEQVDFTSPSQAINAGISIVHQELSLAENLTVAQNVYCHREPVNALGFIDEKKLNRQVEEIFGRLGVDIGPTEIAGHLSVARKQLVEIAKAVSLNARLIIMDEPTSSLSDKEVDYLYEIVAGLKAEGLAIIFISHKLDEVFRVADRISVLRDGKLVGTVEAAETDTDHIIRMMVGRHMDDLFPPRSSGIDDTVLLKVRGLRREGVFDNVEFDLHRGEILGFSGLVGAGRTEVARALFGADALDAGEVELLDRPFNVRNPKESIRQGLCYLTEDRKILGLFQTSSVRWNIVSASLRKFVNRAGFYRNDAVRNTSAEFLKKLSIRPSDDGTSVISLSGGNQQKVLMAKWLSAGPKVLIVDEPTRGVDVGAKSQIHNLLRDLAESGIGVIIISSEQPEIIGLCDRVLVFCEGRITKDFGPGAEVSQEEIMKYASGVSSTQNQGGRV
jgi:ribose transport system ATP-binding protein